MKVPASAEFYLLVGLLGLGAVLGLGWLAKRGATAAVNAAGDVATAVNPLNNENVFAQASNKLTQNLTGDSSKTLGGWIYDITH